MMALFAISCNARGVIYNIPRDLSEDPVAHAHRARIFGIVIAVFLTVIFGIALIYFCQSYWNKRQLWSGAYFNWSLVKLSLHGSAFEVLRRNITKFY
ncbi:unnamed protein product [Rotaria sp. Silwood1]|nr:unnamed protein product [Rotaria sp. Silwood1]CAF3463158.1 unnamed protein product [Rotaria sp. Silwood1]